MMIDGNDGSGITAKKSDLLAELKKNREQHTKDYAEAREQYRAKVIMELDSMRSDAVEGKEIRLVVQLAEPRDHTKDYDRAIRMLEMCTKDEVFISDSEFSHFVMDDWSWKREFVATNAMYGKKIGGC